MGLSEITTTNIVKPDKITVHAAGGVGKTTFGADACASNKGVFILTEDGLDKLNRTNVARFPVVTKWTQYQSNLVDLATQKHDYKTVVIDTVDGLVPLLDEYVVSTFYEGNDKKADAYGSKYGDYAREFYKTLKVLNKLVDNGMTVINLVHSTVGNHKDPTSETWQRWEFNLPVDQVKKTSLKGVLFDWSDIVLYATYDVEVEKGRGSGGERVAYTAWTPAYDAKSRYSLPKKIPFSYKTLQEAIKKSNKGA